MIARSAWLTRILSAWKKAPVVWLAGVRRVGKTVLAKSLDGALFLNCDRPGTAQLLQDPDYFFGNTDAKIIIFDEIHQLPDPSRILKIAADDFPHLKILATGSSTFAATQKFSDSLAGRKRVIFLPPVLFEEMRDFGITDVEHRLIRGGLPPALLSEEHDAEFYSEWMDSYFARDIQELFRLGKRAEFLRTLELIFLQSGGLLEITSLAKHAGVSRPTIVAWLEVFQTTNAIHLLRPYAQGGRRELLAQPKVYAFDTGFVCHARGWDLLRPEDRGNLWEHLVLDTLLTLQNPKIHFWRDKQQREIDFVIPRGRDQVDAIECKWKAAAFDAKNLAAFRENYPKGKNIVVSPAISKTQLRKIAGFEVQFIPLGKLREIIDNKLVIK